MKLITINIHDYFHMIPLWKSPIKLPWTLDPTPHRADKKVAKMSLSQEFLKAHKALMGP